MQNKADLAKIALAALILASTASVNAQVDMQSNGIYLAGGGCAAHGCPAAKNSSNANPDNYGSNQEARGQFNNQQNYYQPQDAYSRPDNRPNEFNRNPYHATFNDFNQVANATPSSTQLTEAQLLVALNAQGRAIYLSLDAEGKALALQLANQDSYRDKNLAVKEAQRRTNERLNSAKH
jgi:hypothetical protein